MIVVIIIIIFILMGGENFIVKEMIKRSFKRHTRMAAVFEGRTHPKRCKFVQRLGGMGGVFQRSATVEKMDFWMN